VEESKRTGMRLPIKKKMRRWVEKNARLKRGRASIPGVGLVIRAGDVKTKPGRWAKKDGRAKVVF